MNLSELTPSSPNRTVSCVRNAFTLVELLVVLTIVGFMFNFVQYYDRPRQWLNERPDLRKYLLFFGTFFVGYLVYLYGDVSGSFIYCAF